MKCFLSLGNWWWISTCSAALGERASGIVALQRGASWYTIFFFFFFTFLKSNSRAPREDHLTKLRRWKCDKTIPIHPGSRRLTLSGVLRSWCIDGLGGPASQEWLQDLPWLRASGCRPKLMMHLALTRSWQRKVYEEPGSFPRKVKGIHKPSNTTTLLKIFWQVPEGVYLPRERQESSCG